MPIERVVAFRFHRDPLVSRARVKLLRKLNPGVPIHGIFGGAGGHRGAALQVAGRPTLRLDTMYTSRHSGYWNWKNGDLVLLDWFRDVGRHLSFDVLHLIEWDLLLTEPLDRLYAAVPPGAVGLTAPTPLSVIGDDWRWIAGPQEKQEWRDLLAYARGTFGYSGTPHASLGVGPCFPKSFVRDYAAVDPPDLGNDELRYPLFAELLGYPVADTGLRHGWHASAEDRFFDVRGTVVVAPETVTAELAKPDGQRAFHPVRAAMNRLPHDLSTGGGHG